VPKRAARLAGHPEHVGSKDLDNLCGVKKRALSSRETDVGDEPIT
jgi:hypothetical protein